MIRLSLLFVVLLTACTSQQDKDRIAQLEKQTQDLKEQLKQQKETANLDLQDKCSKQALAEFTVLGWPKNPAASFSNHYNQNLNKCFLLIEDTDTKTAPGEIFVGKTLSDAFERTGYGEYNWKADKVKKYSDVPPFICHVTIPSGEKKVCHSSDEFDELIKVYLKQ